MMGAASGSAPAGAASSNQRAWGGRLYSGGGGVVFTRSSLGGIMEHNPSLTRAGWGGQETIGRE